MASKYAIEAVFKLIDKVTAPTTKIDKALGKMGVKSKAVARALKNDFDKATRSVDKFGANLKRAAGMAALAGVAAVGAGVAIATKQFIEFDAAVTAASAKFKDVDVTSQGYQETLKKIGKTARDVAAVTEFNAVDTAGALDKMAMAGLTSSQAMSMLMGTTNLATATGMDLTTAVDIATDAMGAFRMMTDGAGNALGENELKGNLNRLSDVMAKTTNMFNTDMGMMFEAIKKGAPTFMDASQSVESFSAMLGVLASSGIKGSDAGTSLKNMMLSLANPSEKAQKVLAGLQIVVKDGNGNYLDAIDIIGQFEKQTKSIGSAEKAAALATVFGTRTVTGMNILLAEGADKLRGYRTELENAGGASENIANAMRGSIQNQIQVMLSALTELGFKFVEAFSEKGSNVIQKITDAISKFDPAPIIEFVNTAVGGLMFFGNIIGGVIKTAWDLRYAIFALAVPFLLYKSAMIAAAIAAKGWAYIQGIVKAVTFALTLIFKGQAAALAILTKGTFAYNIVQKAFALGAKIAAAAQWLLNVAMNANPIGLIIIAVVALIAAIVLLVKNWDSVTAAVTEHQNKVMAFLTVVYGPIGLIVSIVKELYQNWDKVKKAFTDGGIIAGLKAIGGVLLSAILAPVQGLLEILSYIPGLGGLAGKGADKIQQFRNFLKGTDDVASTKQRADSAATNRRAIEEQDAGTMNISAKITPNIPKVDFGTPDFGTPNFNTPDFSAATGAAVKSKLHGVVDISGGAANIPSIGGGTATRTATSGVADAASGTAAIASTVAGIAATLKNIAVDVGGLARLATQTTSAAPPPATLLPATPTLAAPPLPPTPPAALSLAAPPLTATAVFSRYRLDIASDNSEFQDCPR